ncbi:ankyrin repeat domain-containing protein [Legionella israelensis]|uniref:Ankyrin repeat protein n=1 Tax=Legionella israelensis TaxID=454 RepID=A0A0W0W8M8_9GAMM|nr:ankyrin repeat domain-containing protein [Legionella israelensis]KTD28701.1 Ankyrin repeat protein [Legionella israelensis]QBS08767.1 ankyrin repeat domain-containing protein [Legionella israelensis]SCY49000.1 Ankyrin repeat-containing protein [Legionella israelensis DSM 19235]STX58444.1 Ankyrin repeat protein [Legionella israelensis]
MFFEQSPIEKPTTQIFIPFLFRKNVLMDDLDFFNEYIIGKWTEYSENIFMNAPEQNSSLAIALEKMENTLEQSRLNVAEQLKKDYLYIFSAIESSKILFTDFKTGYDVVIPSSSNISEVYLSKIRYNAYGMKIAIGPALPCFGNIVKQNHLLISLFQGNPEKLKETIDLPEFHCTSDGSDSLVSIYGTPLMISIANSLTENALSLIKAGASIDKYSVEFGNNPLLLAVTKGWNHVDTDSVVGQAKTDKKSQKPIIEALLDNHADVNCIHLKNAMTALHIACLRGDDPMLVKMLLEHGADKDSVDLMGRTPADLLDYEYKDAAELIESLLDNTPFGESGFPENRSFVATLPDRQERAENIVCIKQIMNGVQLEPSLT